MSRIVLDTNVVIAAFAARGLCESVFELCLERHQLITSNYLLDELNAKLSRKLKLPDSTVLEIIQLYRNSSNSVEPALLEASACRDPKDVPVMGTCVAGNAQYLVSGDKDLLVLKSFQNTKILSRREFYELQK